MPCQASEFLLVSPDVDVSPLAKPTLVFAANLNGSDLGTLTVEESDGAGGWNALRSVGPASYGDVWYDVSVPLSRRPLTRVRFRYTGPRGPQGDVAIDEVRFVEGAGRPGLPAPTGPEFQPNSSESYLSIDVPPGIAVCGGRPVRVQLDSSLVGQTTDLLINATSLPRGLSEGGIDTPGLQTLNVPFELPSLVQFFQYGTGASIPHPGSYEIAFAAPNRSLKASAQQWVMDPAALDGFTLSRVIGLEVVGPVLPHPGPTGDDSAMEVVFADQPLGAAGFTVPFCGTSFDRLWINSNGTLSFGGGDLDDSSSVGEAMGGVPRFGVWTDLAPSEAGCISYDLNGGVFTARFTHVDYWDAESSGIIELSIDGAGVCTLNVAGMLPNDTGSVSGSDGVFFGLSGGSLVGATDAGPTSFTVGGSGGNLVATDMLYDFVSGANLGSTTVPGQIDSITNLQMGNGLLTFVPGASPWSGN